LVHVCKLQNFLIFTSNLATMTKLKLTAGYACMIAIISILLISCEKPFKRDGDIVTKSDIPMNGPQVVPPNNSAATGTIQVTYNRGTRILDYKITWTGLSGPPAGGASALPVPGLTFPAIGIYGPADPTYMAFPYPPLQPTGLSVFPNGVVQGVTSGFTAATSGSFTGSLFVDNAAVKESDLLNNKYYIQIRTAAFPNGQIRGQIDFR
jgi:hypothetical protein